ncbi:MAG: hypothetical protein Q7S16_03045 [bacterium]|nr:hypothetical protein [bacterium]
MNDRERAKRQADLIIGLFVIICVLCLGFGISKIPGSKSPDEYVWMLIYAVVMIAFAVIVYRVGYNKPFSWERE